MLYSDMMKMFNNCKLYNVEGSMCCEYVVSMGKYLATIFPKRVVSAAVLDGGAGRGGGN